MNKTPMIIGLTLTGAMALAGCDAGMDEPGDMPPAEEQEGMGGMEAEPRDQEGFGNGMDDRQGDGFGGDRDDTGGGFGDQDDQGGGF